MKTATYFIPLTTRLHPAVRMTFHAKHFKFLPQNLHH